MLFALDRKLKIDTFTIYTHSETWAGGIHPSQALQRYRDAARAEHERVRRPDRQVAKATFIYYRR